MSRLLTVLAYAIIASIAFAGDAHADLQSTTTWCQGLVTTKAFIQPLVECFTDSTQGIIPTMTTTFMTAAQTYYAPIVSTAFLVAIAYFGVRVALGGVDQIKKETIVLGLKLAGIFFFLNYAASGLSNGEGIYGKMVDIVQWFSNAVSAAATKWHGSGFCDESSGTGGGATPNDLWERWDCIFGFILGYTSTKGVALAGIMSFLMMMLVSLGTGTLIFFMTLYMIMTLFFAAVRFVHIYLMAMLGIGFMFCLGYIFVPLLLFRNTRQYFVVWLRIVLGYMLQPIVLLGYMAIMLIALDVSLFTGKYSVWCEIGGTTYCGSGNAGSGQDMFATLTNPSGQNLSDSFGTLFFMGNNNDQICGAGGVVTGCSNNDTTKMMGVLGAVANPGVSGSTFVGSEHSTMSQVGLDAQGLNLQNLAADAGAGSQGAYVENVLISICVAALMIYIMYSLIDHIPDLASAVSGGTPGFAKAKVFGESLVKNSLGSLGGMATKAAQGADRSAASGVQAAGRASDAQSIGRRPGGQT